MNELYSRCLALLLEGEDIVIATIIRQEGSAPRGAGTKMLIRRSGAVYGTIGGGILEGRVIQLAQEVFADCCSVTEEFVLTAENVESLGMICGGNAEVFIDLVLSSDPANLELYRCLAELEDKPHKSFLVSRIITGPKSRGLLQQSLIIDDKMIGLQLTDQEKRLALRFGSGHNSTLAVWEGIRYLIEPLSLSASVYIFGAGHVSMQLVKLASMVGFKTIVLDDRAEFASKERFPDADEVIVLDSFIDCMQNLNISRSSYLIIVTRGHRFDYIVLAEALKTEACYIGMIGSRHKRDAIYEKLRLDGVTDEELFRVYSPIGLPINAETPEEIAVSIVAELIQIRAEQGWY